jgi:hypothetical protein
MHAQTPAQSWWLSAMANENDIEYQLNSGFISKPSTLTDHRAIFYIRVSAYNLCLEWRELFSNIERRVRPPKAAEFSRQARSDSRQGGLR